jgi:hypothetical protein
LRQECDNVLIREKISFVRSSGRLSFVGGAAGTRSAPQARQVRVGYLVVDDYPHARFGDRHFAQIADSGLRRLPNSQQRSMIATEEWLVLNALFRLREPI